MTAEVTVETEKHCYSEARTFIAVVTSRYFRADMGRLWEGRL